MTNRELQEYFFQRCVRMSYREHGVVPSFAFAHPKDVDCLDRHQIIRIGRKPYNVTICWDWNRRRGTMICLKIGGLETLHVSVVGATHRMRGSEQYTDDPDDGLDEFGLVDDDG